MAASRYRRGRAGASLRRLGNYRRQPPAPRPAQPLKPQDGLYTLLRRARPDRAELRVIGSVLDCVSSRKALGSDRAARRPRDPHRLPLPPSPRRAIATIPRPAGSRPIIPISSTTSPSAGTALGGGYPRRRAEGTSRYGLGPLHRALLRATSPPTAMSCAVSSATRGAHR